MRVFGCSPTDIIIYQKNKAMTPKELYDWAVENGAEDYDITVDGDAIDYLLPEIDERLKIIEIIR